MRSIKFKIYLSAVFTVAWFITELIGSSGVMAQEEMSSALRRYKDREVSTGYYEEYESMPRHRRPLIEIFGVRRGAFSYSPTAAKVRIRTRLADSHQGIKFYDVLPCANCHIEQTKDIHTVRGNLTCRQCHGGDPIAGIAHAYSSMNSIRRHAYVCAKCHEGASVSFAAYVIHEPSAGASSSKDEFPALYYSYWLMLTLLVGTLTFFIPHTFLVGLRELITKIKEDKTWRR